MIQIDMEMPSCCYDCNFSIGVMMTDIDRECTITDNYVTDDDKPDWCPLIDVPENNVVTRSETLNRAIDCINRQSAINIAKDLLIEMDEYHQYNQAINNYCAELMKLPSSHPNMCVDAVSRQEAIDVLRRDKKGKSSGYSSEYAIVTSGNDNRSEQDDTDCNGDVIISLRFQDV